MLPTAQDACIGWDEQSRSFDPTDGARHFHELIQVDMLGRRMGPGELQSLPRLFFPPRAMKDETRMLCAWLGNSIVEGSKLANAKSFAWTAVKDLSTYLAAAKAGIAWSKGSSEFSKVVKEGAMEFEKMATSMFYIVASLEEADILRDENKVMGWIKIKKIISMILARLDMEKDARHENNAVWLYIGHNPLPTDKILSNIMSQLSMLAERLLRIKIPVEEQTCVECPGVVQKVTAKGNNPEFGGWVVLNAIALVLAKHIIESDPIKGQLPKPQRDKAEKLASWASRFQRIDFIINSKLEAAALVPTHRNICAMVCLTVGKELDDDVGESLQRGVERAHNMAREGAYCDLVKLNISGIHVLNSAVVKCEILFEQSGQTFAPKYNPPRIPIYDDLYVERSKMTFTEKQEAQMTDGTKGNAFKALGPFENRTDWIAKVSIYPSKYYSQAFSFLIYVADSWQTDGYTVITDLASILTQSFCASFCLSCSLFRPFASSIILARSSSLAGRHPSLPSGTLTLSLVISSWKHVLEMNDCIMRSCALR